MADRSDGRAGWTLAVVFTVMFLVSLDLSIVNVALPDIDADLHFSGSGLSWVINAYLLTFAGLMLLGGRLADFVGRRTLLLASLALFAVASGWGGLAQTSWELLAARAVQGVAAAVLAPMSLALVTAEFAEGTARSKAMAVWGGAGAAGGAAGVVLSGLLTEYVGWRAVMWVNVVFAAVAAAAVSRAIDNRVAGIRGSVDLPGAVLSTAGVTALVVAVISTEGHGWTSPRVLGWALVGVVALAAFVVVEARTPNPLVPLEFLRRRSLIGATAFGFMLASAQFASFYFVSLLMQRVLGYSSVVTGLAFLPFCVGVVLGLRVAMTLTPAYGPSPVLAVGGLLGAAGLLWFGFAGPTSSFVTAVLGPSLVASAGIGAATVAMGVAAVAGVPAERSGLASGILNSARQLGGSLGLAVLATVAATVIDGSGEPAVLADGYDTALRLGAGLLAAGAIAAAVILRDPRVTRARTSEGDLDDVLG
ncbi:MFS transporter [Nocardia sp. NPDC050406]|uniref:MFS transporter n=1 Tax=Nocardia sp. NPDC050406 TaxID=3364318 RepID=UPI0037BABAC9